MVDEAKPFLQEFIDSPTTSEEDRLSALETQREFYEVVYGIKNKGYPVDDVYIQFQEDEIGAFMVFCCEGYEIPLDKTYEEFTEMRKVSPTSLIERPKTA